MSGRTLAKIGLWMIGSGLLVIAGWIVLLAFEMLPWVGVVCMVILAGFITLIVGLMVGES